MDRNNQNFHKSFHYYKSRMSRHSKMSFRGTRIELKHCSRSVRFCMNYKACRNIHCNKFLRDRRSIVEHICFEPHSRSFGEDTAKEYLHTLFQSNKYRIDIFYQLLYNSRHSILYPEDRYRSSLSNRNYSNKFQKDSRYFGCLRSKLLHSKKIQHHIKLGHIF